jgi:hypothetical protein
MKRLGPFVVLCIVILVASTPSSPIRQQQSLPNLAQGLPDFSGLEMVLSFTKFPADRTKLATICEMRRSAIDDAVGTIENSLGGAEAVTDPVRAAKLTNALGLVLLYKGDIDGAIARFEAGFKIATQNLNAFPELGAMVPICVVALGVSHMRKGELENCALNHTADMCIFPLALSARHTAKSGSERAIQYFQMYLAHDPGNLEIRWLLNVAYQTLGTYPDKVPKPYLIPPSAFESKEDVGRFVDVGPVLGLDYVGNAGGSIVDDFDNDGFFDIVQSGVDPCEPMHMFHNNGDGTFTDVSARSGLAEQTGGINCTQADYNNDGWLDVYVMRGGWEFPMRNSLLRNNRDGTFTDVTAESGLLFPDHRTQSASWADYDNDGWLDLYVGHEMTPSQLFRNLGDGTFEDVSTRAGVDGVAFTKAVVWGDYDADGYPDIYASNFRGDNFLYHNRRDGTFEEVARRLGVEKPERSFPCWFWDYDNDGALDLFVSSYTFVGGEWVRPYLGLPHAEESMKLYRNIGKGAFADVTKEVGLDRGVAAMGSNYGDLDNDGFLDFYLGTGTPSYSTLMPNLMFRNRDGKAFVDVTTSTGTGHLQKGHGVAFADIDNDGNEDICANIGGAVLGDKYNKVLFENPGHANRWISLKLVGVKSNRAAIGAKIKVTLTGPAGSSQFRYRDVSSGGSFGSSPLAQHIGLGKAPGIASVEVTWPASKTKQVFTNIATNQYLEIKEFEKTYQKRRITELTLKKAAAPQHVHAH